MLTMPLVLSVTLVLAVIFVNGWTDSPNAIATAISTRCLTPRVAVVMAVICNALGVAVMTMINAKVAETISKIVTLDIPGARGLDPIIVLSSSMISIVLWSSAAWYFGLPTSESHALVAALTGGAVALSGNFSNVHAKEWGLVLAGLGVSTILGLSSGFLFVKLIGFLFKSVKRATANKIFTGGQIFGAASMAFMHGAQDGQKFMGVFVVALQLNKVIEVSGDGSIAPPWWMIVLCAVMMGLGTSAGGYRIIKSVGMDMVKLEKYQGFAADMAAAGCLLFSSLTGIPVSTTHTKTTAIMGVGTARRASSVNWLLVKDMVVAWILVFPGCGLISFLIAKLALAIF